MVAERWWLVAGRLKTGMGRRDPEDVRGEPLVLRRDAVRLTSLFGWRGGGVRVSPNIGVVEPECEKAIDPAE